MTDNSTGQAVLDVAVNSGMFGLIEMGMLVIIMLVISISKIVSQCKKASTSNEKLKILQDTFNLNVVDKIQTNGGSTGTTDQETLNNIASSILGSLANTAANNTTTTTQNTTTVTQETVNKAVEQSLRNMVASGQIVVSRQSTLNTSLPSTSSGILVSENTENVNNSVTKRSVNPIVIQEQQ